MPDLGGFRSRQARYVKAQLIRAYQNGGRAYIDAHLARGAGGWTGIPVIEFGGGRDRFVYVPMAGDQGDGAPVFAVAEDSDPSGAASAQVWLFFDGHSNFPVCIGAVQHHNRNLKDRTSDLDSDGNKDVDQLGHQDIIFRNTGSVFVMDQNGNIAVAPKPDKIWNLKLEGSARARISRGGKATEKVLLGRRAVFWFKSLHIWISALEVRISALETAMTQVLGFLATGAGGPFSVSPPFVQVVTAPPDDADDTMLSAVIDISDDAETA